MASILHQRSKLLLHGGSAGRQGLLEVEALLALRKPQMLPSTLLKDEGQVVTSELEYRFPALLVDPQER